MFVVTKILRFLTVDWAFSFRENTATLVSPSLEAGLGYTVFPFPLGLRKMILPSLLSLIKCLLNESLLDWKRFIDAHSWDVKEHLGSLWWSGAWMLKCLTITCPHQGQCPSHRRHRCCCLLGLLRESQLHASRQNIGTRTRRSRAP